jgi:hypothetical protein
MFIKQTVATVQEESSTADISLLPNDVSVILYTSFE